MKQLIKGNDYQKYEKFIPSKVTIYALHLFLFLISVYGFFAVINTHAKMFEPPMWNTLLLSFCIAAAIQYIVIKYKSAIIELIVILAKKEERKKLDIWAGAIYGFSIFVLISCVIFEIMVSAKGVNSAEVEMKNFLSNKHAKAKGANVGEAIENKAQAQYDREMANIEKLAIAKEQKIKTKYEPLINGQKNKASKAGEAKQWASSLLSAAKSYEDKQAKEIAEVQSERAEKEAAALADLKKSQAKSEILNTSNFEGVNKLQQAEEAQASAFATFFNYLIAGLYVLLVALTFIIVLVFKKTNTEEVKVERHTAVHSLKDMFYSCESVFITFLQFCNRLILKLSNLREPEARDLILRNQRYNVLGGGENQTATAKKIGFATDSKEGMKNALTIISANELADKWLRQNQQVNEIRLSKTKKGVNGTKASTAESNIISYKEKRSELKKVNEEIKAQIFPTLF